MGKVTTMTAAPDCPSRDTGWQPTLLGPTPRNPSVEGMNENHAVCESPESAEYLQNQILPSLPPHAALGAEMLEIGPGPGAATDWLRHKVKRLTAVEVDEAAAAKLASRYEGTNVEVVYGDATSLSYPE